MSAFEESSPAVADAWTRAMREGGREQIERLIAPDIKMWRNTTRAYQPRADFIELAVSLSKTLPGFRYAEIRCAPTANGFVQQHLICGTGPSGQPFEVAACIFCEIRDSRIVRMDEYYDSAQDPR